VREESLHPRFQSGVSGRPLKRGVSVRHVMRRLLPLTLLLCGVASAQAPDDPLHILHIAVRTDNLNCLVLDRVIPCGEVTAYLLSTLRIPLDQPLMISAEGADPSVSRSLATTLSNAGFRSVVRVGFITQPNHGTQRVPSGAR